MTGMLTCTVVIPAPHHSQFTRPIFNLDETFCCCPPAILQILGMELLSLFDVGLNKLKYFHMVPKHVLHLRRFMFPTHTAAQYQYLLWLHPFYPMILEKQWLIMGSTDQCAIVISYDATLSNPANCLWNWWLLFPFFARELENPSPSTIAG